MLSNFTCIKEKHQTITNAVISNSYQRDSKDAELMSYKRQENIWSLLNFWHAANKLFFFIIFLKAP